MIEDLKGISIYPKVDTYNKDGKTINETIIRFNIDGVYYLQHLKKSGVSFRSFVEDVGITLQMLNCPYQYGFIESMSIKDTNQEYESQRLFTSKRHKL